MTLDVGDESGDDAYGSFLVSGLGDTFTEMDREKQVQGGGKEW